MKRAVLLLVVAACAPTVHDSPAPGYTTSDRDGLGTQLGDTCLRLRTLGCPEGFTTKLGRTCFEHMTNLVTLASVPAACIKASATVDGVRSCGGPNDVRIRCYMPSVDQAGSALP